MTNVQMTPAEKYQNAIKVAREMGHTNFTCFHLPQVDSIAFNFFGGGGFSNFNFGGDQYFMEALAEGFIEEGFVEGGLTSK